MSKIEKLVKLNEIQKNEIVNKFGSIDELYNIIFDLQKSDYIVNMEKPQDYSLQIELIKNKLLHIEEFLDKIGIDGHYIIFDIAGDFGIMLNENRIKH